MLKGQLLLTSESRCQRVPEEYRANTFRVTGADHTELFCQARSHEEAGEWILAIRTNVAKLQLLALSSQGDGVM